MFYGLKCKRSQTAEGVKAVQKDPNFAFLMESSMMEYYNQQTPCNTMTVGPNLNVIDYGFATPKESPYLLASLPFNPFSTSSKSVRSWILANENSTCFKNQFERYEITNKFSRTSKNLSRSKEQLREITRSEFQWKDIISHKIFSNLLRISFDSCKNSELLKARMDEIEAVRNDYF